MDDFVAHRSKWRMLALIALSFGFVAAGLWMTGLLNDVPVTRRYPLTVTVLTGWFCIVFFGFCALVGINGLLGSKELLRVGQDGLRLMPWSDQAIPWDEIVEVTTWEAKGQTSIVLHLHNPDRFPAVTMFPAKMMLASQALNRSLTGGDISFSLTGSNRTTHQALLAIRQFKRDGS